MKMHHFIAVAVLIVVVMSCSSIPRQRILSAQELGKLDVEQIRRHEGAWCKKKRQAWDTLRCQSVWDHPERYDDTWRSYRESAVLDALECQTHAEFAQWMASRRRDVVFRGLGAPQGTNTPITEVWISRIYVPVGARLREFINAIEDAFAREVSWRRQVVDLGRLPADVFTRATTNAMRFQGNPQDCAFVTRELWNVNVRVRDNVMVFEPVHASQALNEVFCPGVGFVHREKAMNGHDESGVSADKESSNNVPCDFGVP